MQGANHGLSAIQFNAFVLQLLMRGLVNASPIILEFASGEVNELMPRS